MSRMEAKDKRRIIEALILSSTEPISAAKLAEIIPYCKPGQAGRFLEENWDEKAGCVMIDGRIPINPHRSSAYLRKADLQNLKSSFRKTTVSATSSRLLIWLRACFCKSCRPS